MFVRQRTLPQQHHHVSVFPPSFHREDEEPITMIRSLLAVVGMATMAGEFVVVAGYNLLGWRRDFERETEADSAGDGNNPLVV